jgi:RNA polymerase sigma-70 factor, ECF subfamily
MPGDTLVRRAQQGDPQALEELCQREWRSVFLLVRGSVRDRAEAEDLTQEVFYRALRSLDRYQDTGSGFRAYLATIARNLVRDRWKRKTPVQVALQHLPDLSSAELGPEEHSLLATDTQQLLNALSILPTDYQQVILLRVAEGRSCAEVAKLMRRSAGAVRVLQHRAIAALRDQLERGSQA